MQASHEIELAALLEKFGTDELPEAAARLLEKWCEAKGTSHDAIYSFYAAITDNQSGEMRDQLDMMSATYSASAAVIDLSKS